MGVQSVRIRAVSGFERRVSLTFADVQARIILGYVLQVASPGTDLEHRPALEPILRDKLPHLGFEVQIFRGFFGDRQILGLDVGKGLLGGLLISP